MDEIDEDEAKRMVLMELMKELGVGPESALSDDLSREQYADDQARDTYAYYGLAMYMAQVFEHEVVNLLVLVRIVKAQESAERIMSDPWEQRFRQTLGQLSQQLRPYLEDDQQLMEEIADGVQVRNRLAHSYWREHAEDAASIQGRNEMITELIRLRDMFADLDARLTRVSKVFRRSLGITDDCVQAQYDEIRRRIAERDKFVAGH